MTIRFSLHGSVRNFSQGIERARQAEALGFEAIFVADSQMTCLDPFQALAICAGQTKRLGLGTAVTNMVYRDPTVLASSAATLNEISEGRAIVRSRLANRAHHNFRFTLETVPPEELPEVKKFMDAFDISKPLEEKLDPSLVTDYLVRRFSIAGTPEECADRVKELERAGVSRLLLTPPEKIYREMAAAWSAEVMPRV